MTFLPLLSDFLLLAATLALSFYCWRLSRRLKGFDDAETGVDESVETMATKVAELEAALAESTAAKAEQQAQLDAAVERAEDRIGQLEMLIAAAEDVAAAVPEAAPAPAPTQQDIVIPSFRQARPSTGAMR
jgi:hypothetical protein